MLQKAEKLGMAAVDADVETEFNKMKAPYTEEEFNKQLAAQSQAFPFTVDRVGMAFVERQDGVATIVLAQYTDGGLAGSRPAYRGNSLARPYP